MTITVIVPSYKRLPDLKECVRALDAQTRPAEKIIIVVQDGDLETKAYVLELAAAKPNISMEIVHKPGLIAAINAGLRITRTDIVALTDDDARAHPDWLLNMEKRYLSDPSIGAVGGRDVIHLPLSETGRDASAPPVILGEPSGQIGGFLWYGKLEGNHHCECMAEWIPVAVLKGVNVSFRTAALGGKLIDEGLHGTGSQPGGETDLCLYVGKAGWKLVFDSGVTVDHYISPRPPEDARDQHHGAAGRVAAYNMAYVVGKYGTAVQIAGNFLSASLLGSRFAPGMAACVLYLLKREPMVLKRLSVQWPERMSGYLDGMKVRRRAGGAGGERNNDRTSSH